MQRKYLVPLALFILIVGGIWAWDYAQNSLPEIPVPEDARAQSGLPVCAVELPDGTRLAAEIVTTPKQQKKGLMFRDQVPPGTGMLFVYDETDYQQIWMKNVSVSLDVVFLDENRKITRICREIPIPDPGMSDEDIPRVNGRGRYILELASGEADRLGLRKGMRLTFEN